MEVRDLPLALCSENHMWWRELNLGQLHVKLAPSICPSTFPTVLERWPDYRFLGCIVSCFLEGRSGTNLGSCTLSLGSQGSGLVCS